MRAFNTWNPFARKVGGAHAAGRALVAELDAGLLTRVTWAMTGPMPHLSKLICMFVSMERMVGPDFEAGLANLKAAAEKG